MAEEGRPNLLPFWSPCLGPGCRGVKLVGRSPEIFDPEAVGGRNSGIDIPAWSPQKALRTRPRFPQPQEGLGFSAQETLTLNSIHEISIGLRV